MMRNQPQDALASYRFAVEHAPEVVNNWMNMLTLTAQLDRPRLLEEALRALKAHPDNGEIIQVAVGSYREAGKAKEAFQVLKDALKRNPENPLLHFQMGLGLAHAGKFEKAADRFTKALEFAPRFPRAFDARGNCLERLGRTDEAQKDFERSKEIRQEDADREAALRERARQRANPVQERA
jgi:tetratricopeptide (TPR) repeat protein